MSADRLRLFYTEASQITGDEALITGDEAAHLVRALRMKPGEQCRLATEAGDEFIAEISNVSPKEVSAKIIERLGRRPPPPLLVTLGLPLIKGERFEWALEKTTELGVTAFRPLALSRCEVKIPANKADARTTRWERIAREAAKQCGRIPPPLVLGPAPLDDFLSNTKDADLKLIAWLGEGRLMATEVIAETRATKKEDAQISAALILGPEGDLTPEEVEAACAAGFIPVDMGPRVLRADTAPVVLVTMLQAALGDMA